MVATRDWEKKPDARKGESDYILTESVRMNKFHRTQNMYYNNHTKCILKTGICFLNKKIVFINWSDLVIHIMDIIQILYWTPWKYIIIIYQFIIKKNNSHYSEEIDERQALVYITAHIFPSTMTQHRFIFTHKFLYKNFHDPKHYSKQQNLWHKKIKERPFF